MGVKLKGGWRGAGRIAAAIFDKENVIDNFYPEVRRDGISAAQKRAHRAFFGGRIELIHQGFHEGAAMTLRAHIRLRHTFCRT